MLDGRCADSSVRNVDWEVWRINKQLLRRERERERHECLIVGRVHHRGLRSWFSSQKCEYQSDKCIISLQFQIFMKNVKNCLLKICPYHHEDIINTPYSLTSNYQVHKILLQSKRTWCPWQTERKHDSGTWKTIFCEMHIILFSWWSASTILSEIRKKKKKNILRRIDQRSEISCACLTCVQVKCKTVVYDNAQFILWDVVNRDSDEIWSHNCCGTSIHLESEIQKRSSHGWTAPLSHKSMWVNLRYKSIHILEKWQSFLNLWKKLQT